MNTLSREKSVIKSEPKRYIGLDILKFICSFMVVSIHSKLRGEFVPYYIAITRAAVPVFFMITGFFYGSTRKRGREIAQIKKIGLLTLSANIFFLIWEIIVYFYNGEGWEYLEGVFSLNALTELVFFNISPACGHLWYLGAILYVLIIAYFANKYGFWRVLYILTPILLFADLIFGNYSILIFGNHIPAKFVRNFLVVGLPYFCIGNILQENMQNILSRKNILLKSGLGCIIFALTAMVERYFLTVQNANATRDHGASILFLSVSLFIFFVALYQNRTPSKIEQKMAFVGNKFSTRIYILHPVFIRFWMFITRGLGIYETYRYVANIFVFALTTAVILIHYHFTKD